MRSSRASEQLRLFFEPLQLHLQPPYLLDQFGLLGLTLLLIVALLAPGEQLAGTVQQLPLPLAQLNWVDDVVCAKLLERLAATDHHGANFGLKLWVMDAALTYHYMGHSGALLRLTG